MEHIQIYEVPENIKYTKGEKLYEQYTFDLWQRRYLNGAHGFEENPFTRWYKLSEDERQSWNVIANVTL